MKNNLLVFKSINFVNDSNIDESIKGEVCLLKNISKYSLEEAILTILSNNNAKIYRIDYCLKEKTLIFYSDNVLDISFWESRESITPYKTLTEAINELDKRLHQPEKSPSDCVPMKWILESLSNLYHESLIEEEQIIKEINEKLELNARISFKQIEYYKELYIEEHKNTLMFSLKNHIKGFDHEEIIFEIDYNGGNFVVKKGQGYPSVILEYLDNEIEKLFRYQFKYFEFFKLNKNMNFFNSIMTMKLKNDEAIFTLAHNDDYVTIRYNYDDGNYISESNQRLATKIISENEAELMNNFYVCIDDCPEIIKEELFKRKRKSKNESKENATSSEIIQNQDETNKQSLQELLKMQREARFEFMIQNIQAYLLLKESKLNLSDIDIICDYNKVQEFFNIDVIKSLTLIKVNDKIYISIGYGDNKILEITNEEIIYNVLIKYIFDNIDIASRSNFLSAGFYNKTNNDSSNLDWLNNYPYLGNDEDYFLMNKRHLLAIKEKLYEHQKYDYNPEMNYCNIKEDNKILY